MTAAAPPARGWPAAPRRWRDGAWAAEAPAAPPAEAAVAIVFDGTSQAVLMATPEDLIDLARGFALTEGMIPDAGAIVDAELVAADAAGMPAWEARLWLAPGLAGALADRRRTMLGPTGCGLCGIDSLSATLPAIVPVRADLRIAPSAVGAAMTALRDGQRLYRATPAIHAAAFIAADAGAPVVREDVGRHNALDKLAGALAGQGRNAAAGVIAMTSRLSVDLVQKAARMQAPVLIGAGAPTALALRWADAAGMTLVGRASEDRFDLHTHPHRIA